MAGELPLPNDDKLAAAEVETQALKNSVQLAMTRWDIERAVQALGMARAEPVA